MVVKPVSEADHQDLTADQLYVVLGIEADDLRILNDQGRPYLYPRDHFELVDAQEPEDWQTEFGDDRERYSYPPALNGIGFFEDFFEGEPSAVSVFWRVINKRLAAPASRSVPQMLGKRSASARFRSPLPRTNVEDE